MISVAAARQIISENTTSLPPVETPLAQALGMVLAIDVFATIDIPAFPQSSMDGYAFSFTEWQPPKALQLNGVVPAGHDQTLTSSAGQATRIFTGAPVPPGADTVMQEKVKVLDGELHIEDEKIAAGMNVRPRGSEIKGGELALGKGIAITPAGIGFLAGIGVTHVTVYAKSVVSIIVTGKELQQPGKPLSPGQVYESNSATLTAALQQLGITNIQVFWADDDLDILISVLNNALQQSDAVLLTGGISVGDYDFVLEASTQCGVTKLFHKIKQRPGKPLYFGKKEERLVFGLPGNPSSVLTCFYEYVMPALQQMSNRPSPIKPIKVPLGKAVTKLAGLTHFLKGWYNGETVEPLNAQESYRLSSYAKANCLVQLDEEATECLAGQQVEIHLLPV